MVSVEKAYTVTQINKYLKALLDEDFILRGIKISGEVSNFKLNYAGHAYFTLKDDESSLSCVMFAGDADNLSFLPRDGMKISAYGNISIYIKSGQYQLYVRKIEREGKGDLFLKFEELKRKLAAEGIFDVSRKKPIPVKPARIAVITSPTGAAVRDIVSVIRRRNRAVKIVIFPVSVQGEKAAREVSDALYACNSLNAADTIIIGRGGGSIEDLWAFNEEIVARALYASEIPVISAVGHETDFTIADFAADLRAATPSVSAEIAVPLLLDRREQVNDIIYTINSSLERILTEKHRQLETAMRLIDAVSPLAVLKRGYSLTYGENEDIIRDAGQVKAGDTITTALSTGKIISRVTEVRVE